MKIVNYTKIFEIINSNNKKVAIYGTGKNAEKLLTNDVYKKINNVIDDNYANSAFHNIEVCALTTAISNGIDTIIIAAELDSELIVLNRIKDKCIENSIEIYDIYGVNLLVLLQKFNQNKFKSQSLNGKYVVATLEDCLIKNNITPERLIDEIEKELINRDRNIPDYIYWRKYVGEKVKNGRTYSLDEIYEIINVKTGAQYDLEIAKAIEKELIIKNSVVPQYTIDFFEKNHCIEKAEALFKECIGVDEIKEILNKNGLRVNTFSFLFGKYPLRSKLLLVEERSKKYPGNVLVVGNTFADALIAEIVECGFILLGENVTKVKQVEKSRIINNTFEKGTINLELSSLEQDDTLKTLEFEKTDAPIVSIIIPAFNQIEYTYNCLRSIKKHSGINEYEIIIADDASTDETKHIEDIITGVNVIHNEDNLLFIKNCNRAASYARGKYILFLNNDTQVQPGWLDSLIYIMENDSKCGIVGSKLVFPDGTLQEAGGIIWNDGSGANYGRGMNPDSYEFNYVREVDYVSGASMMIRKDLWTQIGGFDESLCPAYYEDADLAFSVRSLGYKVMYQPESVVVHFEGVSNGKDIDVGIKKHQKINKETFFKKWESVILFDQYLPGESYMDAADRKGERKTVIFVSDKVPEYDRDAGSRTIFLYMKMFINNNYLVKLISDSVERTEPYVTIYQRMGIEVMCGDYWQNVYEHWINNNKNSIDYVFMNYPNSTSKYIDLFKNNNIPIRYYGMDLHFMRLEREYEIKKEDSILQDSKVMFEKEKDIIEKADIIYYPSLDEVEYVKNRFGKNNVKQLLVNFFDTNNKKTVYEASSRLGLLFVGGFSHRPNVDAMLWFLDEIFPIIEKHIDTVCYIVGSNMPGDIKKYASDNIKTLGRVSDEELEKLYKSVRLVIAPLRYGAGIKGKIIEAMSYGVPVVSTAIGMEGIPPVTTVNMIGNKSKDFANVIIDVYDNASLLNEVSREEINIIDKYYSNEVAWNNIREDF